MIDIKKKKKQIKSLRIKEGESLTIFSYFRIGDRVNRNRFNRYIVKNTEMN